MVRWKARDGYREGEGWLDGSGRVDGYMEGTVVILSGGWLDGRGGLFNLM